MYCVLYLYSKPQSFKKIRGVKYEIGQTKQLKQGKSKKQELLETEGVHVASSRQTRPKSTRCDY